MAKEIVTHVWCDPCMGEDKHTPSHEVLVGFDRKWMTLDLCEEHELALVKPLRALLEEYGAKLEIPTGPTSSITSLRNGPQAQATLLQYEVSGIRKGQKPKGPRGAHCLWCPMTYSSGAASGLTRHLAVAHGFANISEALGHECPVCGRYMAHLGGHVMKQHADLGLEHTTQAFLWARDNGDPHGVYAAVTAQEGPHDKEELFLKYRKAEARAEDTKRAKKA